MQAGTGHVHMVQRHTNVVGKSLILEFFGVLTFLEELHGCGGGI
jgi:hypothetical protein